MFFSACPALNALANHGQRASVDLERQLTHQSRYPTSQWSQHILRRACLDRRGSLQLRSELLSPCSESLCKEYAEK